MTNTHYNRLHPLGPGDFGRVPHIQFLVQAQFNVRHPRQEHLDHDFAVDIIPEDLAGAGHDHVNLLYDIQVDLILLVLDSLLSPPHSSGHLHPLTHHQTV